MYKIIDLSLNNRNEAPNHNFKKNTKTIIFLSRKMYWLTNAETTQTKMRRKINP